MQQTENAPEWAPSPSLPLGPATRLLSAGRATGQWLLAFGVAFALTAGVLVLAHV